MQSHTVHRPKISGIVVCFNEEKNIGSCLESLQWCDEIVVVDSFSTDLTVEICGGYTDRIFQRAWAGYRDQKSFAHSQATQDWVLAIDADERVPPALREEILRALSNDGDRYAGYALPRVVYYLGRWWWRGGWYPDYNIRLVRRELSHWSGVDPHAKIRVSGKVRRLRNPLHHFSYRDITDHITRVNNYTDVSSRELRDQGTRWCWSASLIRPPFRFFRFFLWKRGLLEGLPGFFIAATAAFYVFMKYAKLRELELNEDSRRHG